MSIRTVLESITGITRKENEGEQDYLLRLIVKADKKITDEIFNELDEETQDWFNDAVEAVEMGTSIPWFTDEDGLEVDIEETEDVVEEIKKPKIQEETKTKTPAKAEQKAPAKVEQKVSSKAKQKAAAKTKQKAAESEVKPSRRIVQLALSYPNDSYEELSKKLAKEGMSLRPSTIRAKAFIAREAYAYLESLDKIK